MKILAVNGSPKGRNGNTERILEAFLSGTQNAGAEPETVYLADKDIRHCIGCYSCWTRTPGVCVHRDDMAELLSKIKEAEILVFATPLYYSSVTGLMKDFIDRMLPLSNANLECENGYYYHKNRTPEAGDRKTVLISNCGFPGRYNFSALQETFKMMFGRELDAAILCSEGELLGNDRGELKALLSHYLNTVAEAGKEVVQQGRISSDTQSILDKELIDPELYLRAANSYWDSLK